MSAVADRARGPWLVELALFQVATTLPLLGQGAAWAVALGAIALVGQLSLGWKGGRELLALAAYAGGGYALEALHVAVGQVQWGSPFAPPWVVISWLAIGAASSRSLAWVRAPVAAAAGAVLSPLSFLLADAAGVLTLARPLAVTLASLALTSGALLYVLFSLRETSAGVRSETSSGSPRSSP